jgi:hypothetical protein
MLVDENGQPSSSGESAPFRERNSVSFRLANPKPDPQNHPDPGLFRPSARDGEGLGKGRLERAKGFDPRPQPWARVRLRLIGALQGGRVPCDANRALQIGTVE